MIQPVKTLPLPIDNLILLVQMVQPVEMIESIKIDPTGKNDPAGLNSSSGYLSDKSDWILSIIFFEGLKS